MQKIENGDMVQLTASMLMGLARTAPEVYTKLMEAERSGGIVTDVNNDSISIDMGPDLGTPLTIQLDAGQSHLAVQLVKKADQTHPDQPAQPLQPSQSIEFKQPTSFGEFLSGVMGTGRRGPSFTAFPLQYVQVGSQPVSAEQQQLAQWIITQFLQLKEYTIAQDLRRVSDAEAGEATKGEEWNKANFRPVLVELTAQETTLYNTALKYLCDQLSPPSANVQPAPTPIEPMDDAAGQ